jgi:hypothetical protein
VTMPDLTDGGHVQGVVEATVTRRRARERHPDDP